MVRKLLEKKRCHDLVRQIGHTDIKVWKICFQDVALDNLQFRGKRAVKLNHTAESEIRFKSKTLPINQSIDQARKQTTIQSINQSINHAGQWTTIQSIKQAINGGVTWLIDQWEEQLKINRTRR